MSKHQVVRRTVGFDKLQRQSEILSIRLKLKGEQAAFTSGLKISPQHLGMVREYIMPQASPYVFYLKVEAARVSPCIIALSTIPVQVNLKLLWRPY